MKVDKIIDLNTYEIKWDEVWSIDEFKILKETKQTPIWHSEGCVDTHTQLVTEAMSELIPYDGTNGQYRMIMLLAALFHDIGKGATTYFSEEKQDYSSPKHDIVGEKITRALLFDEDIFIRETICFFVRNHMKPLYIFESPTKLRDVIRLSHDSIFPKYCTNENLIKLKECDNKGSIMQKDDKWKDKLEYAILFCKEHKCFDKPYEFNDEQAKYFYFNETFNHYPKEVKEDVTSYVNVLIGLDDNKIEKLIESNNGYKDILYISLKDFIKRIKNTNEKNIATRKKWIGKEHEMAIETIKKAINIYTTSNISFIIDVPMLLKRTEREELNQLIREKKNVAIRYYYFEDKKLINKENMMTIDFPSPIECFNINII